MLCINSFLLDDLLMIIRNSEPSIIKCPWEILDDAVVVGPTFWNVRVK